MNLLRDLVELILDVIHFGVATRRFSVVAALLLGVIALALVLAVHAAAPVVLYPFA